LANTALFKTEPLLHKILVKKCVLIKVKTPFDIHSCFIFARINCYLSRVHFFSKKAEPILRLAMAQQVLLKTIGIGAY
jgi:hypothetical protein